MGKLIMIDDNPMEHLIMQKIFDRHNLFPDAVYSNNGHIILDLLKEKGQNADELPDLIFLNLHMPLCSGGEFLNQFESTKAFVAW